METVSLQDLQRDPLGLLSPVEAGESILVARAGRPVAELRPVTPVHPAPRPFGLAAGTFVVPVEFDAPLPEDLLREFEGR